MAVGVNVAPSPPVFGIATPGWESSGWEAFHMRFGKLKAPMAVTRSVAQIKKALGFTADLPFCTNNRRCRQPIRLGCSMVVMLLMVLFYPHRRLR